jgi:translation elongation factor EF-4
VEAQTLANVYIALENELEIIPVLNKIDLPGEGARAWAPAHDSALACIATETDEAGQQQQGCAWARSPGL